MIREEDVVTTRLSKRAGSARVGPGGVIVLAGIVVAIIRSVRLGYERRHELAAELGKAAASILALVHQEAVRLLRRTAAAKWVEYRPTSRFPAPVCYEGLGRAER